MERFFADWDRSTRLRSTIDDHTRKWNPVKEKFATLKAVSCHTHLIYGGGREHNLRKSCRCFLLRHPRPRRWKFWARFRVTREASFENLYDESKRLLDYMLRHGRCDYCWKPKSGHGLDYGNGKTPVGCCGYALNRDHEIDLVSTFYGNHRFPPIRAVPKNIWSLT